MTRSLLTLRPTPVPAPVGPCAPQGGPSPEWHDLRLFGRGRHPANFEAGRERIGQL
jgi:hypothetical protein